MTVLTLTRIAIFNKMPREFSVLAIAGLG